jgi:hypothetical protein
LRTDCEQLFNTIEFWYSVSHPSVITIQLSPPIFGSLCPAIDHGQVLEYDTPYNLLQNEDSVFRDMCLKSGELDILMHMAQEKHDSASLA